MLALLLLFAQAAAGQAVATCRAPGDPQQRIWTLERAAPDAWRVVFTSRALDNRRVELLLAAAQPVMSPSRIQLSFASAAGGRAIEWQSVDGFSRLDIRVNHRIEVKGEPDLDPAVEAMNTGGELVVVCDIMRPPRWTPGGHDVVRPPVHDQRGSESGGGPEWQVSGGIARSVGLYESAPGRV